jgi:hypothetical protein
MSSFSIKKGIFDIWESSYSKNFIPWFISFSSPIFASSICYSNGALAYFFPEDYSMVEGSKAMLNGKLTKAETFEWSVIFAAWLWEGIVGETRQTKIGSFWLLFYFRLIFF